MSDGLEKHLHYLNDETFRQFKYILLLLFKKVTLMSEENSIDSVDLTRLEFTQTVRERIVNKLTMNDEIPSDPDAQAFLMKALDGIDRAALAKARLKQDDKSQSNTANIIAEMLRKHRVGNGTNNVGFTPVLDSSLIELNIVDGETSIGSSNLRYDDLMT